MSGAASDRPSLLPPLAQDEWPAQIPVLIVGGGPVGLLSAILLAQRGIEVLLIERRSSEARFPRAHLLNVRAMEVFDETGIADDIYAAAPKGDEWRKVVWYTSIAGPTPLHGLKLGEVSAWGGGADEPRYAQASPCKFANLPQIWLDPIIWRHAEAACPGRIRAFQELVDLEQHDKGGVTATITDVRAGTTRQVKARYLIAADGGRTTLGLLGVVREGQTEIQDVVSCHISTDLSMWSEPDALLAHIIHPAGQGRPVGILQSLGPNTHGRHSQQWAVGVNRYPDEPPITDEETALARVRQILGLPLDHPITVHSVAPWQFLGVVAQRYRVGSVFLAGDAAHRHPPTGGLGLNMGAQDVHNLAWKLAAVLKGQAEEELLDTYDTERRPVAAYYVAHSLENAGRHAPIGSALGLKPGMSEEDGWRAIGTFVSDTAEGDQTRARVADAVAENVKDYSQLNVEAGFFYPAGALIPDGTPPPEGADSPVDFRPTTRPGHHLPHVWLRHVPGSDQDRPTSSLALVAGEGLTLFTGPSGAEPWRAAADRAERLGDWPLTVVVVPAEDTEWASVREVAEGGAVLVRPDRKVCWRVAELPADPGAELGEAVSQLRRGGSATADTDPAKPYLERIRVAAARIVG